MNILERCTALGQIYKLNAPCQIACYNQQYCPSANGACPSTKIPYVTNRKYNYEWIDGQYTGGSIDVTTCFENGACPILTPA